MHPVFSAQVSRKTFSWRMKLETLLEKTGCSRRLVNEFICLRSKKNIFITMTLHSLGLTLKQRFGVTPKCPVGHQVEPQKLAFSFKFCTCNASR